MKNISACQSSLFFIFLLFLSFFPFHQYCCAADKYDEAAAVLKPYVPALKKYLSVAETSEKPEEIAGAMNSLSDSMEQLAPKIKRLTAKYPGIENAENLPARHQPFKNELVSLTERFTQSYLRIMPFMLNPQLQQANSRMLKILGSVGATI